MNRVVKVVSLAAAMASGLMGAMSSAQAQSNYGDPLSLKIANAISPDRFFVRAGAIGVKIKTKSEDTYDETSPVITTEQINRIRTTTLIRDYVLALGETSAVANQMQTLLRQPVVATSLLTQMGRQNLTVLGTPLGIKAVAKESAGTAGLSLGYFLDEDMSWVVEAYVLAAPLKTAVIAERPGTYYDSFDPDTEGDPVFKPFGLQGQEIITSKIIPPTLLLGKYWGGKNARFRPYTGLLGMYAVFYDVKASEALNQYQGGSNPGDTTATLKNTFGVGPMLGFKYQVNDGWHVSLNVGSVKLKTKGRIVTRNSVFTINTPAIQDYGRSGEKNILGSVYNTAITGENTVSDPTPVVDGETPTPEQTLYRLGGATRVLTGAAAWDRTGSTDNPTYVRGAKSVLTNTIFMLSVGRSF